MNEHDEIDGITLLELIGADYLNRKGLKMTTRRCTTLTQIQQAAVDAYWKEHSDDNGST